MPRRDEFHYAVTAALEKEGWKITHDHLDLSVEDTSLFADLGAEAVCVAERQGEKIAIEIKTFKGQSLVHKLHEAIGQYEVYRVALSLLYPEWTMYLAIPDVIYNDLFQRKIVQELIKRQNINLLVYSVSTETIALWI